MDVSTVEKCSKCSSELTVKLYRDEAGWRCERCAPSKVTCEYEAWGCTHQDLPIKCKKHALFFCEHGTTCWPCDEDLPRLPRGTLSTHYNFHTTFDADFSLRAHQSDAVGQYSLVASPAGTAMCYMWVEVQLFLFRVHMPVLSEQLCQYQCEIRVIQVSSGHTKTYTPDVTYNKEYDWCIEIDERDFPSGTFVFDVFVNIKNK